MHTHTLIKCSRAFVSRINILLLKGKIILETAAPLHLIMFHRKLGGGDNLADGGLLQDLAEEGGEGRGSPGLVGWNLCSLGTTIPES